MCSFEESSWKSGGTDGIRPGRMLANMCNLDEELKNYSRFPKLCSFEFRNYTGTHAPAYSSSFSCKMPFPSLLALELVMLRKW